MDVAELAERLLERFPAQDAESWDHVGLSVGDPVAPVTGVAVALDVTPAAIAFAEEAGASVLITHHPVYIKAPDAFVPRAGAYPQASASVWQAARRNISVISLHTNLDRSRVAREHLVRLAGWEPGASLEHADDAALPGLGCIGEGRCITLDELACEAAEEFHTDPRVWGDPARTVSRIAVLGGSLGGFGDLALACGCEAVICGEAGYHVTQDLASRGCSVVLLGHDRSEQPFVDILKSAAIAAGVEEDRVGIMPASRQWWTRREGDRS